jgi:glycosyltransferase involved in cell wall biosynthesis
VAQPVGTGPEGDGVTAGGVRPVRVVHVITRLIVGGAQENTVLSCALIDRERFPSDIVVGPQTGPEGELFTEARARGLDVHVEPTLVREVNPPKDALSVPRLASWFRRLKPDVVHTHSSKAGITGRVAARMAGVKAVVHTVHGWGFHSAQPKSERTLYENLERWCAPLSDALVVVADRNRELGLRLGIGRPEQYRVIRSGIELAAYRRNEAEGRAIRTEFAIPNDAYVFGTVGRLSDQKAPHDALEAFVRVAPELPDAWFVFVGDGPHREDLVARAAAAGVAQRVRFAGLRRDVRAFLSAYDAFVLSSRWEGLPRVVLQAMAAGLPVVATAVDGTPEAIDEGESGYLVAAGDVAALADRMLRIGRDRDAARHMGTVGLSRVGEFSAERMVEQLGELYAGLTARANARHDSTPRARSA